MLGESGMRSRDMNIHAINRVEQVMQSSGKQRCGEISSVIKEAHNLEVLQKQEGSVYTQCGEKLEADEKWLTSSIVVEIIFFMLCSYYDLLLFSRVSVPVLYHLLLFHTVDYIYVPVVIQAVAQFCNLHFSACTAALGNLMSQYIVPSGSNRINWRSVLAFAMTG